MIFHGILESFLRVVSERLRRTFIDFDNRPSVPGVSSVSSALNNKFSYGVPTFHSNSPAGKRSRGRVRFRPSIVGPKRGVPKIVIDSFRHTRVSDWSVCRFSYELNVRSPSRQESTCGRPPSRRKSYERNPFRTTFSFHGKRSPNNKRQPASRAASPQIIIARSSTVSNYTSDTDKIRSRT